jgi:hypothetical protein
VAKLTPVVVVQVFVTVPTMLFPIAMTIPIMIAVIGVHHIGIGIRIPITVAWVITPTIIGPGILPRNADISSAVACS